ncbi:MAG: zinc ABC transporter substrate-binding protein [Candidatus Nitrohelix vancouverensis]|uniref:Zinc ABC transporter substrate-binding protein n=1 Tax=Candidatus Nitrohelix vancouverensis TaxID=2705534 RepID=A0A7T0C4A9_9BACT|nr:MAG: zinc ABC transporter substrate-binding protein [Candidatus Nitrohelix vancouverensis]
MKQLAFLFMLLMGAAGAGEIPAVSAKTLEVTTTTPGLASIARSIGGDRVEVQSILKGYQDAHFLKAKPSYMLLVNRSNLLIYQGFELEASWLPLLIQGARNPRVLPGASGILNASLNIRPLETPLGEVDRSMGDVHPQGNPHYLLDPVNGLQVAESIKSKLAELAPEHAEDFESNLKNFQSRLKQKIEGWNLLMEPYRNRRVATYHKTFTYFLNRFGLEVVGSIERKPGVPPSAKHLASLADSMKRTQTNIIIQSNYYETRFAEKVASLTSARVLPLPVDVGGEEGIEEYMDLFDALVNKLVHAFEED